MRYRRNGDLVFVVIEKEKGIIHINILNFNH